MDTVWEFVDLLWLYASMVWKSYTTTVISGTAMGIFLAQGSIFLALGIALYLLLRLFQKRKQQFKRTIRLKVLELKGKRMSGKEREEYVRLLVEDALTTTMEELYFLDMITLDEKRAYYKKLAREAGLAGICSYLDADTKEQIKRRIKKGVNKKPSPLPDENKLVTNVISLLPSLKKRNIVKKSA